MTIPTGISFRRSFVKPLSVAGQFQPGCYVIFYITQTTTLAPVYRDANLNTQFQQYGTPLTADGDGRFPPVYLDPTITYDYKLYSKGGILLESVSPFLPAALVTGTFTPGVTGFEPPPNITLIGKAEYTIFNSKIVHILLPYITGTSSGNTFTITGLPSILQSSIASQAFYLTAINNTVITALATLAAGSGTLVLSPGFAINPTGWNATAVTKGLQQSVITYFLS